MKIPLIVAVGLTLALGACSAPNTSVQWGPICVPTDDCTFAETCDAQWIGDVVLDPGTSTSLWLIVQVANTRTDNTDASTGHVKTTDAYIQEFDFEFEGSSRTATTLVSSYLVPGAGTSVVSVQIPFPLGSVSYGTVVTALVRAKGVFADGSKFETGELRVPVTVAVVAAPASFCAPTTPTPTVVCPAAGQLPVKVACQ